LNGATVVRSGTRRFVYCGRLIELKGLVQFVDQLAALAEAQSGVAVELAFAGDGPIRDILRQRVLPDSLRLTFLGSVAYESLPEVYRQADVMVFPSLADEWGLAVVEAMASGLPILGSLYSQAVEDLVEDGITGWTFRPDRSGEMKAAIRRALSA